MTANRGSCELLFLALALSLSSARAADEWPQFRGPTGQGLSDAKGLPLTWSETANIVWKTSVPGLGYSSPVASGNRIWLTASPDKGKTRHALCFDLKTGQLEKDITVFTYDVAEPCHAMNSHATPTPVLEGGRVYVTFGNPGTACLDAETGKTLWERRDIKTRYLDVGAASSPVLCGDALVLTCDGQSGAKRFVTALDKNTGKTLWSTDRTNPGNVIPKRTHSSCTPLVIEVDGKPQLISPGGQGVRAYDPLTGHELWVARYEGWSVVPRPVYADGLLLSCGGSEKLFMYCIRPEGASGDITDATNLVWKTTRNVPSMPSPLMTGNRLYLLNAATMSCLEPATGKAIWSHSLSGQHLASPVSAEGRIYLFNSTGGSSVIAQGDTFSVLATNRLDSGCYASPAIVGQSLIVRTTSHLYRIGK